MALFQLLVLKRTGFVFAFLICLLPACTVGPNYHGTVQNLPAHYSASKKTTPSNDINQFWQPSFKDPVLNSLIAQGLSGNNTDIEISYAKIRQARAELGIQKAQYFPQINAAGKISRDRLSGNSEILVAFPPGVVPLNYTDYKFGFDASWELDVFGHTRRSVEASTARFLATVENQQLAVISVAAEIANVYTQYRVYQQRINIAKKTIASFTKTEKLVRLQMQAGVATSADLKRVESEVLSFQGELPFLYAESKATLAALAVLVGEYPESLFKKLSRTAPVPAINTHNLTLGLPSELLIRRPDIRMAERNLAASTADIGVAVSNLFPRFQLIGNFGSDTTIPGAFFDSASKYWTLAPHMSLPIFTAGKIKNDIKAREAARDIALANYKNTVLKALADVESNLIRYHGERARKRQVQASANKLHSALRLLRMEYEAGTTSLINILDVERQLNQLNDKIVQSAGQETINLISLYKSLGGSWLKPCRDAGQVVLTQK